MNIEETKFKGCFVKDPKVFGDERGYFFESFNNEQFIGKIGYDVNFGQNNQPFARYGALQGLHLQKGDNAQVELVRVLSGKVIDVTVDLHKDSTTYGQHVTLELSAENKKQLFVPRGFTHGFDVLSETAKLFYKVDNNYAPHSERGLLFNEKELGIDWYIDEKDILVGEKDYEYPLLKNYSEN